MSRSYTETLFRHKFLCLAPLLVATVLGGWFALSRPTLYTASAAIFADSPLPDPSTIGTTGTAGGSAPPSAGQQALMSNFLATRSFLFAAAKRSGIAGVDAATPPIVLERSLGRLASQIKTTTPGPNVMLVQVTQPDPAGAIRTAQGVVAQFLDLERQTIDARANALLADAQGRLDTAGKAVTDSQQALADYHSTHSAGQEDPARVATLRTAVTHAQDQYTQAQKDYQASAAALPVINNSNLFLMDRPTAAYPKSHVKALILGVGGGLLGGGVILVVVLMLLVSRDTVLRTADDVESTLTLPVSGTVGVVQGGDGMARRAAVWRRDARASAGSGGGAGPSLLLTADHPEWVAPEIVQACRNALRRYDNPTGSVAVTGVGRGDGATTIALGAAIARHEDHAEPTVLIDLVGGPGSVGERLGLDTAPGVADVLAGEVSLDDALQWPSPTLAVLTRGEVDDARSFASAVRRSTLVADLTDLGYFVVADLPPLPPEGQGDRIAHMFAEVLMVVRSGRTQLAAAQVAARSLTVPPSVVINQMASPLPRWLRHGHAG